MPESSSYVTQIVSTTDIVPTTDIVSTDSVAVTGEIVPDSYEEVAELDELNPALSPALNPALLEFLHETPRDIHAAFADFLHIDVANGDATDDTIRAYHREVAYFVAWCQEYGIDAQRARRRDIEAYRESLKSRGLSVTTRSHKLSIVRRFYEAALKHNLVQENPAARVRGGKDLTPPEEKIKALTHNALLALALSIPGDTLNGKRDRAIVSLMAVHGLRRIEVQRLNHDSIQQDGETPTLVIHGKGNRIRKVYLREDTYNCLQVYMAAKLDHQLPCDALFVSHSNFARGHRLDRRSLNKIADKYLTRAALKKAGVSCHALRHTHGTLAVAGGAKLEHVRDEMGHQHSSTTDVYVRAVGRVKNNPANFIDVEF